ncbi:MAG: hypothetical protein IT230_07635 [Flavobacteriales bacterium]|nr:hypothetical protein [Flavobacteriales bacterium]
MARWLKRICLSLLPLMVAATALHAQAGIGQRDQERIQAEKKKTDAKEVKKEEKRLYKKHLSNQDKATRKRMKRNKRRADRQGNSGHREPFFRRLFGTRH